MPSFSEVFFTYIVKCADETFYIGKTNDLQHRLKQHNGLIHGGAKYTRARKPVKLIYSEKFPTQQHAIKREIELKKLTRKQKEELINHYYLLKS